MRLYFEFILHLLFELFDNIGFGSILSLVLRGCEILRAEIFIIITCHKIMFRVLAVALDINNE